jgi:hypothetical protein
MRDPRIVHQHIEPGERFDGGANGAIPLFGAGNVEVNIDGGRSKFGGQFATLFVEDIGNHYAGTRMCHRADRGGTDATGPAAHQGNSSKIGHVIRSFDDR